MFKMNNEYFKTAREVIEAMGTEKKTVQKKFGKDWRYVTFKNGKFVKLPREIFEVSVEEKIEICQEIKKNPKEVERILKAREIAISENNISYFIKMCDYYL